MATAERRRGGFELANGRAADRVSEEEAEAGRSRRRSRTASAAASPWHDPGLRLQRLHKEAFLGAAVSLLVRGRRRAGRRPGPPGARRAAVRTRTRALGVRMWPPPRPPARAAPPPVTGGRATSLLSGPPAGPLYGQELVPSCPLVGGRPFSPPAEAGSSSPCQPAGIARSSFPVAASGHGRSWPGPSRPSGRAASPRVVMGYPTRGQALAGTPIPGTAAPSSKRDGAPVVPGTPPLLGDSCPGPTRNILQLPARVPGPLGPIWGLAILTHLPSAHPSQHLRFFPVLAVSQPPSPCLPRQVGPGSGAQGSSSCAPFSPPPCSSLSLSYLLPLLALPALAGQLLCDLDSRGAPPKFSSTCHPQSFHPLLRDHV